MSEEEGKLLFLGAQKRKHKKWFVISIAFVIVALFFFLLFEHIERDYTAHRESCFDYQYWVEDCPRFKELHGDLSRDEVVVLENRYQFLRDLSKVLTIVGFLVVAFFSINSFAIQFQIVPVENRIRRQNRIKMYRDEARRDEKVFNYRSAIKIYEELGEKGEIERVKKLLAHRREKARDYDTAINIYEELGEIEEAARVRKLKARQGSVRVAQKVVHGDEITKTDIRDSVISKSNVGAGGKSKSEELRDAKALLDDGIIDDDEFQQMKKEILGK